MPVLVVALLAMGFAWFLTGRARGLLAAHGIVDVPNDRSSHERVVPRGGGVVIVAVASVLAVIGWNWTDSFEATAGLALAGAVILSMLGFIDDRVGLGICVRLSSQLAVSLALCTVLFGRWDIATPATIVAVLFGAAFLTGATNIYNFMDGIDGLASLTAISIGVSAVLFAWNLTALEIAILGAAVAGACIGFLRYNWTPARIFMGDTGSLYLGFLASVLPLVAVARDPRGLLLIGALVPFLIDGVLTIGRRRALKQRLTEPHRTHLYQRASRRWGHARVSAAYGSAAGFAGIVPLAAANSSLSAGISLLAAITSIACLAWLAMSRRL